MKTFHKYTTALFIGTLLIIDQADIASQTIDSTRRMSVEPGIGISPMPIMDVALSNIFQVQITRRVSAISYTSIRENNLFLRNFNYINSTNNHTLTQKLGLGLSLFTKRGSHTFSVLGGVKYETYNEFLNNPQFEKVEVRIKSVTPDVGFMYNLKLGQKKYFFSYRMYIPLFPYPFKTRDLTAIDANVANVSLEFGIGIRLNTANVVVPSLTVPAGFTNMKSAKRTVARWLVKSWFSITQ